MLEIRDKKLICIPNSDASCRSDLKRYFIPKDIQNGSLRSALHPCSASMILLKTKDGYINFLLFFLLVPLVLLQVGPVFSTSRGALFQKLLRKAEKQSTEAYD